MGRGPRPSGYVGRSAPYTLYMRKLIPIVLAGACAALLATLALQDPLSVANLTPAEQQAGLRSVQLEVNGANCRFCRIHVERTLRDLPGVKVAKADMARHEARVVYDPNVIQPSGLMAALRGNGVGAGLPSREEVSP
jgi:copper chaperone CopZ